LGTITPPGARTAWLDVSAGVAGDMLLGALVDAGAALASVQAAVDQVLPGAVRLSAEPVVRASLRAVKLHVAVREAGPPRQRHWREIRALIGQSALPAAVAERALAVFSALAAAEGRVHGIDPAHVHFHEVGALDSIADIVGTCAALADLGITSVLAGRLALGSGTVRSEHGALPVPVPAVLEMARGWPVSGGGSGELATPTGVALVTTLATASELLPPMRVDSTGTGAGTRDSPGRANVVRVVLGELAREPAGGDTAETVSDAVVVEANIDDLDPRAWPSVLAELLAAGASDAWLTPILMKKGRPAHTVHALAPRDLAPRLRAVLFGHTTTFGVRELAAAKYALPRRWIAVGTGTGTVRIKIAHQDGVIVQATPEFDDASQLAAQSGQPVRAVLAQADAAASAAGLVPGLPVPAG
jgi:uncharacterized protein (TIGR00299 family) protein